MSDVKYCPDCGEPEVLHEIEENVFGCDNCKKTFDLSEKETIPSQPTPGRFGKDEWGNPEIPETIL